MTFVGHAILALLVAIVGYYVRDIAGKLGEVKSNVKELAGEVRAHHESADKHFTGGEKADTLKEIYRRGGA